LPMFVTSPITVSSAARAQRLAMRRS
jgi:hypothetical protein